MTSSEPTLAERWRALSEIADGAIELAPMERAAFVERATPGDVALRDDVRRLLDACERAERARDFLAEPAATLASPLLADLARRTAAAEAAVPAELSAALAGRYVIERELGRGGMAVVYLARDVRHRRDVAFKVLRPDLADAAGAERFLREIETVARLRHPNILALYDSGESSRVLYYVMPFVEGESLRARLARGPRLPLAEVLRIAHAVADALDYAHRHGVIHRDVKPENILLDGSHPMVADFGISRAVSAAGGDAMPSTSWIFGTPAYVSPEQARGERETDARSDVYSLGCVVYEMLGGEPPFTGATAAEIMARHVAGDAVPLGAVRPDLPPHVERVVMRALACIPADRFPSAAQFAAALRAAEASIESQRDDQRGAPPFVAVLPFDNLAANPETEYFSDGITEDIIAGLSKMSVLRVISRASAMRYKRTLKSARDVAADLGVSHVVQGSVRRAGNRVRIVAELVEGQSERQLWADAYERQLTDIFAIQSDVALRIATALRAELTPDERARVGARPTRDLEAYELYLKGRQCVSKYTEEWLQRALAYYERAIARDPDYALAYSSIAFAYVVLGMGHGAGTLRPAEAHAKARSAVETALALDQELGEAHGVLGFVKFVADFDWAGAERELTLALELSPGSVDVHSMYGLLLSSLGRTDEAIATKKRAQELDPLTTVASSDLTSELLRAGRWADAAREAERLTTLDPGFPLGHSTLGWAYLKMGRLADGLRELERAAALSPGNTVFLAQLGQAYGETGRLDDARETLRQLEKMSARRYVSPYHVAYVYTGLGERERAIDWLERAVAERAGGVYGIKGSFLFTSLRDHPRFRALLQAMGLDVESLYRPNDQ